MATPPATHPASYCPDAAHTLQWGVRPGSTTQGWILARQHDDGSSVVAVLDGYPHGRTPVPAGEAQGWADRILGTAQEWLEQPARSGAYHRHNTAAVPVAAPPTGQTGLRDRIADAVVPLLLDTLPKVIARARGYEVADAVLALLPATDEPHRLALSTALGLGTSAPWDAIRVRAAELAGQGGAGDRGATLTEAERTMLTYALDQAQERIWSEDGFTDEDQAAVDSLRQLAAEHQPETQAAAVLLSSPCAACDHTLNWHRNDIGCVVARCVCSRFQPPVDAAPTVTLPGKEA